PLLKRKATRISNVMDSGPLFETMVSRLRSLNGAGLAAPQIGQPVAAVVAEVRKTDVFPDRAESPLLAMANPEIVEMSEEVEIGWEGCFSVPGLMGQVERSKHIRVRFTTPESKSEEEIYSGYLARVIQHEIDHLDAIEFVHRMSNLESLTT